MAIESWILLGGAILFIVTLGGLGAYWSLSGINTKKGTPQTIDIAFLKGYYLKNDKEKEVRDEDMPLIRRYTSTGLMQTGLSKDGKLTAKLSTRGRRLIE